MINRHLFYVILIVLCLLPQNFVVSLRLKGTWNSKNFFLFLARFGFQKTDPKDLEDTQGFIYGNITSKQNFNTSLSLLVADSEYFVEFYGNRTLPAQSACEAMFNKVNEIAFQRDCYPRGKADLLRTIPCPKNRLCEDEDNPSNVEAGYQFTYKIQDSIQERFWYLGIVACHMNTTSHDCRWKPSSSYTQPPQNIEVDYDIWLVNGDPASKHQNPFEHQFSFELHDVFEIHLVFLILYTLAFPVWLYAYRKQIHPITKLCTACISLEYTGIVFNFIHVFVFAFDGVGVSWLQIIGNAIDTFAQCLFILLLLLIAKGWTIINMELSAKPLLFSIWGLYTLLNSAFFVWNLTEKDIVSNIDEWNSWPGYLILAFRLIIMIWFTVQLRLTFKNSQHQNRLDFFQQFGAFFLVWFIYMPILAAVVTQISYLWRYKTILGITYAADLLAYLILMHLLWPSRSVLYLIKGENPLPTYDLEVAGLLDDVEETEFSRENLKKSSANNTNSANLLRMNGLTNTKGNSNGYHDVNLLDEEEEEL